MTLDPEIEWVLGLNAKADLPLLHTLTPQEARAQYEAVANKLDLPIVPMSMITERAIGRQSLYVKSRLYVPEETKSADPMLIWFHGGGWTIGSLETHDRVCRGLAAQGGCRVLSVNYRLAPEHPFPSAVEDALAVFHTVMSAPKTFGADPKRIAVGGDSAGGNLAAVLCHEAKAAGDPMPCLQMLIYPSVDIVGDYDSKERCKEGYLLTEEMTRWFVNHYLPNTKDRVDPRAAPLYYEDFTGLPQTHIQTAGYDPLQDEAAAYADKLRQAGVQVDHRHYPGLIHGYFNMAGSVKAAKVGFNRAASVLRQAFYN